MVAGFILVPSVWQGKLEAVKETLPEVLETTTGIRSFFPLFCYSCPFVGRTRQVGVRL